MSSIALLKFQIGPVQDFIAQARSTRDLWSGSYLLSWLVAAGIKTLPQESNLIFPNRTEQPLLQTSLDPVANGILIPNLPNIFIATVSGDAKQIAKDVTKAIKAEWKNIAKAVWTKRQSLGLSDTAEARFFAQVDRHLSISWMATKLSDDSPGTYLEAYRSNGWHLDAVRQTRDFMAWKTAEGPTNEKDSLSGKEEAIFRGSGTPNKINVWHNLLNKHTDHMGAVAIIKRVWHLAYLSAEKCLRTESKQVPIRSIPAIAARQSKLDDDEDAQENTAGEKYIAAIAFDGDSIGKWVNGDFLPDKLKLRAHHESFSAALSEFAMQRVPEIVEPPDGWLGQLIYAGGDDVVCLVPADAALDVATQLREAFRDATRNTDCTGEKPDASAGIAIAHIHSPLQDLIREAQKAEKRAKNTVGRPAFSVALMKRSGEISHWGAKWDSGGIELYEAIAAALKAGLLSPKFPHRVSQLLTPYLTQNTGLSLQADAEDFDASEIIQREFAHTAERQGSNKLVSALAEPLRCYLAKTAEAYLSAEEQRKKDGKQGSKTTLNQTLLRALDDLCTTVAFADRNRPKPKAPKGI
jgi:CRISPR-associated protein Cmr2